MKFGFCFFFFVVSATINGEKSNQNDFSLSSQFYVARLRNNRNFLEIEPKLTVKNFQGEICGFELSQSETNFVDASSTDDFQFRIDKTGLITVKDELNRNNGEFEQIFVRAFDCRTGENRRFSGISMIFITFENVDQLYSIFTQDEYFFKVFDEENCSDCRLETIENDRICAMKIIPNEKSFSVSKTGKIKIEKSLSEEISHFEVTPIDCQNFAVGRPARVTIQKIVGCKPKLLDPRATKILVDADHVHLFEAPHVQLCGEKCSLERISARLRLETNEIEDFCQKQICEMKFEEFSILEPNDDVKLPFLVPKERFSEDLTENFLLRFSFKNSKEILLGKQQILCSSDGKNKNRRHFSVFIRDDRLNIVVRKKSHETKALPAQWSWKIEQISDGRWHFYKILVDFPSRVDLFVDETIVAAAESDSKLIEDFPFPTNETNPETVLVIGGCWHARSGQFVEKFRGEISSISVEKTSKSFCSHRCKEFLEISSIENENFSNFSIDANRSALSFETNSFENFENILKHVVYRNEIFPVGPAGRRKISLETTIKCFEENSDFDLTPFFRLLSIDETTRPVEIRLENLQKILVEESKISLGVEIFSNFSICSSDLDKNFGEINECSVATSPELLSREKFFLPDENFEINNLEKTLTKNGFILSGVGSIGSYEKILRRIVFSSKSPIEFDRREFSLICLAAEEQISTNEIRLEVEIQRNLSNVKSSHFSQRKSDRFYVETDFIRTNTVQLEINDEKVRLGGWPVVIVVSISIAIAGTVVLYLIVRIRDGFGKNRRIKSNEEDFHSQIEWDDEIGLNIIVNPLDKKNKTIDDGELVRDVQSRLNNYHDIIDDDYEDELDRDEVEEDEDEEYSSEDDRQIPTTTVQHRLEWDDASIQHEPKRV